MQGPTSGLREPHEAPAEQEVVITPMLPTQALKPPRTVRHPMSFIMVLLNATGPLSYVLLALRSFVAELHQVTPPCLAG